MKNYGFITPVVDDTHYQAFGGAISLSGVVLQANGDWTPYLPKYERQFGDNWDSYGCTVFGTLNCLETIFKKVYDEGKDFSERYIYNLAAVTPPGSDPHLIAETIRKQGVVNQEDLPFIDSLEGFSSPRPMTKQMVEKGHKWLEQYGFKHEWVFTGSLKDINKKHQLIREHLKFSPLGVSVTAWLSPEDGAYPSNEQPNTHWCMAFKIDENGQISVFDSYDQEVKLLTPDHDIQFAKRYNLEVKDVQKEYNNIIIKLLGILKSYVAILSKGVGGLVAGVFSKRQN